MKASSWFSKMTGTALTLDNLEDVLHLQLRDLYSAEEQLIEALPKMAEAASSAELKSAFETHLVETRQQKARLEQGFRLMGAETESESCEAMKGLIAEGEEIIGLDGDPDVKDAALIGRPARGALRNRRLWLRSNVRPAAGDDAIGEPTAGNARRRGERGQDPDAHRREFREPGSGAKLTVG